MAKTDESSPLETETQFPCPCCGDPLQIGYTELSSIEQVHLNWSTVPKQNGLKKFVNFRKSETLVDTGWFGWGERPASRREACGIVLIQYRAREQ